MPLDLLGSDEALGVGLRDVSLELGLAGHLRKIRAGSWVTEERFREEQDQLETQR